MGMEPIALIITFNTDKNESWFRGVPEKVLQEVSKSLNIPIRLIKTSGETYAQNFEKELLFQKENGVEVCIFSDIDIEEHLKWCTERCEAGACGENEEYHTFVSDGPLFSYPVPFTYKDKVYSNHYVILPIQVKG